MEPKNDFFAEILIVYEIVPKNDFLGKKNFFLCSQYIVILPKRLIVYEIELKKTIFGQNSILFQMISKLHHFARNIDSLRDRAKTRFFGQNLIFSR